jgi:PHD/YefM family antitoxin component YafN of YafNO toxin-antitoxin module
MPVTRFVGTLSCRASSHLAEELRALEMSAAVPLCFSVVVDRPAPSATTLLPFRPASPVDLEKVPMLLYIDVYKRSPMTELTISEARKALLDLPEKLARTPERAVTITRRGQPVLAILPWEFYESVVETLEILGDPEMVTALRESLEDLTRGRVVGNEEAKKRLGV